MLVKVAADHDHIEQSIANLRPSQACCTTPSKPRPVARGPLRVCCPEEAAAVDVDANRAVTVEEDCAEIAVIFQHAQAFDPGSTSATRAVEELVVAIRWHIDAEEATLFAEEAALFAEGATPSRLAS